MTKAKIILINAFVWLIGLLDGDCTFAVVVTLFSLPAIFEKKGKNNVRL